MDQFTMGHGSQNVTRCQLWWWYTLCLKKRPTFDLLV